MTVDLTCVQRRWEDAERRIVHVEGLARSSREDVLLACEVVLQPPGGPVPGRSGFAMPFAGLEFVGEVSPIDGAHLRELTAHVLVHEVTSARSFAFHGLPERSDVECSAPPYTLSVAEAGGACDVSVAGDRMLLSERAERMREDVFDLIWLLHSLEITDGRGRRLVPAKSAAQNQYGIVAYRLPESDGGERFAFPVSLRFTIPDEVTRRRTRAVFRNVPITPAKPGNLGITHRAALSVREE